MKASVILLACFIASNGCATIGRVNMLSTKAEIEIGRNASYEVSRQYSKSTNKAMQSRVDSLGQILVQNSKRKNIDYHFSVLNDNSINAFALPGGWVYINSGLVKAAQSDDELSGVIAHEIGHIVCKHGARQITKQFGIALIVGLAVSNDQNQSLRRQVATATLMTAMGLSVLKYSRDAEREADRMAVDEMIASNMDPYEFVRFFERLAETEGKMGIVSKIMSTHPTSLSRVKNIRKYIEEETR